MSPPNQHLVSGRVESPQASFAGAAEGVSLAGWTDGSWAVTDAVLALLDLTGPADVTVSTWTFKGAKVKSAFGLVNDDRIRSLRFLPNESFVEGQPDLTAALRERYGEDCVVPCRVHSKFAVLTGGAFDALFLCSMNLHSQLRLEHWLLSCGGSAPADYLDLVDSFLAAPPPRRRFSRDGRTKVLDQTGELF